MGKHMHTVPSHLMFSFCPLFAAFLVPVSADGSDEAVSWAKPGVPTVLISTPLIEGVGKDGWGPSETRNPQLCLPDSFCLPTLSFYFCPVGHSPVSPGLVTWSCGDNRTKDPNTQVTFKE